MKKIGLALIALLVLVNSALASTQIWSNVVNYGGATQYSEVTYVNGYDWSEPSDSRWQTTGVVEFAVNNDGKLNLNTYVNNPGQWVVEKYEDVTGTGVSEISKQLTVWTEDKTVYPGTTTLKYPTQAWVSTEFVTQTLFDSEDAYFKLDIAPAETIGAFAKIVHTTDAFNFGSAQGIGVEPCNSVEMPQFEPIVVCPVGFGCKN